jgi:hypothetical protein
VNVTTRQIDAFCATITPVPAAHVLLSANVFVAAHRAVALALAGSATVRVRPSRREPLFARLLAEAAPGVFDIVDELVPEPGDALWAYGSDETLAAVRTALPTGVVLHAHGSGFGVAVVAASRASREIAVSLALDMAAFDQRGCLSPRAVVFVGNQRDARAFAELVAVELSALEKRVPLGMLDPDEAADVTRFRDAVTYAGATFSTGPGTVAVGARFVVAPIGRNLHVVYSDDPARLLAPNRASIAALGFAAEPELETHVREHLPGARSSDLGWMQRPPFDGPVDRRRS